MTELYIIGAGSVGLHIAFNIKDYIPDGKINGFFDDDPAKQGSEINGIKVLGPVDDITEYKNINVVMGIAFPRIKKELLKRLGNHKSWKFPPLISRHAWLSKNVQIGKGSIIYPNSSVNYSSQTGDFVVMNMNCAIGHECRIGSFSSLAPGVNLGGRTEIGEECDVGIGVCAIQNIKVGDRAVIGGQSLLLRNVNEDSVVYGVPAHQR